TVCNNNLTSRRGVIESPNFPNTYPHNHNCTWIIKAPKGSNLSIAFSHLFLEGGESCEADYIEVLEVNKEEKQTQLGKYCGSVSRPPGTIQTTTNIAIVRLVTDHSISREGFRLEWVTQGCGADIYNKYIGTITSPNYPDGYPFETTCYWHISYPPGNQVQLTVNELDMEGDFECRYDHLRVYGGEDGQAPRLLNLCTHVTSPQEVVSHGSHMFIEFNSDHSISRRGFSATFRRKSGGCGGVFKASESIIMTPNYPNPYNSGDECDWLIQVDSSHLVVLEFYEFELPEAENDTKGYVAVYDGNSTAAPLILKKSGKKPEGTFTSTGNQLLVKLVTNGVDVANGFKAHYKIGCGGRLLADEGGVISSPSYFTFTNCSWIIYASTPGDKVSLITTHLHMPDYGNCTSSYLSILDGDRPDSPLIEQLCGFRAPPPILSRGSILHVLLKSGSFRATYGLANTHCGGTYLSKQGTFGSPGYPSNYDMDIECVWTIEAAVGNKVHISFQDFNLEDSEYCNRDYVEIHENNESGKFIGRYCGNRIPNNLTDAPKLWIKFRTDDVGMEKGFLAHFELEHNVILNGTEGEIASPGFPNEHHETTEYAWTVYVPDGMFVSVRFLTISITTITDDYQGNFRVKVRGCYEPCWEEVQLNSTESMNLNSPNYPRDYPNKIKCTYILRAPSHQHVELNITELEVEWAPSSCSFDRIEIFYLENPNVNDWSLNSTKCGREENLYFVSPTNIMKLVFTSDEHENYKGFSSIAKSSCGTRLRGPSGVLKSESFHIEIGQMGRTQTISCEYYITVKPRRTIEISFDRFYIPAYSSSCSNYILLRNGGTTASPFLHSGKFCGSTIPEKMESSSNEVYVQIVITNIASGLPDFELHYSELSVGCGGHLYVTHENPYVEISSPNYPSPPVPDTECEWIIVSPSGTRMRVDFESEFKMLPNCHEENEATEYLELHNGGTEMAEPFRRFCGNDQPSSWSTQGNALFARYVTAVPNPQAGFKARVGIGICGGTISSFHANVRSPNYPNNYGNSQECIWYLKVQMEYHWTLEISDLNTPSPPRGQNCSATDYLEIRNGDENGKNLLLFILSFSVKPNRLMFLGLCFSS
ncbi:cubilin, partial [Nephila pilipes]